jgi:hypothetical protein
MCCIVTLFLLIGPRVALIAMWLFTDMVSRAFPNFILPLLGCIFLPFTTIFYVFAYGPGGDINIVGWLLIILGFIIDIGSYGGGVYGNRKKGWGHL